MEMLNINIFALKFLFLIFFSFIFTINASNNDRPSCFNNNESNETTGNFHSPNFPHEYPSNSNCTFIIEAPFEMRVLVTVQSFLTEKCCDHLFLYDGIIIDNKDLIIDLSGRRQPNETYTTFKSNIMVLIFISDSAGEYEGFNFTFEAINASIASRPPATISTTTVATKASTLSEIFSTTKNTIFSKSSISTSKTSTSATKKPTKSYILWIVIGSIIFIIILILIILLIWIVKIRAKRNQRNALQNEIHSKAGNANLEKQIPKNDKKWKMFLDSKNLNINFDLVLGKGANATVYKASYKTASNFPKMRKPFNPKNIMNPFVAAKVPSKFDEIEAEEFIREINSLIFLKSHSNIISFIGWTMYGEIPVLVTELAEITLLKFVESFASESPIKPEENFLKTCLQIIWQITNALEYLAEKRMIHRDIACRNILLKENNIAKLSDFGLCCASDENGIFKDFSNEKFPLKWLSIEALTESIFSEKSDVWAFGISCWEMFSYGSIPYSNMLNSEMIGFLQEGNRLSKPSDAPAYIYELMLHCWDKNVENRPCFKDICKGIRIMLEVETLNYGYLSLENKPF